MNIISTSTKILIRKWEVTCGEVKDSGEGQTFNAYDVASPS